MDCRGHCVCGVAKTVGVITIPVCPETVLLSDSICFIGLNYEISFMNSPLRLNVTLTRAKRHLILVGHATVLNSGIINFVY